VGQVVEVLRGAAQGRVPGDGDLDVPAHLQQVAGRVVAEGGVLHGAGDHEGALAGLGDGQPHGLQRPQGLAQYRAADLQRAAELGLGGELVADGVVTALDGGAQMRQHRFHGADAPRGLSGCPAV